MINSHHQFQKFDYLKAGADIIDQTDPNNIYMGYAKQGHTDPATAGWNILLINTAAGIITFKWANGQFNFAATWDNRAAETYAYKNF